MIGPANSFMYDNPSWTINGSILIIMGVVILGLSFLLSVIVPTIKKGRA